MDTTAFGNRLRKNQRHWGKWARRRGISCYRIYDRDLPEYPLAIDWYEGRVHVQTFTTQAFDEQDKETQQNLSLTICEALAIRPQALALKIRQRQSGSSQYEKTGKPRQPFTVHEAGLAFEVDLQSYLDTGLFLDHRNTRAMVREASAGKRVLNLFAYTGSFSVYAAAGGAHSVTSVDLSNTYLSWARRNMLLNGLDSCEQEFVRSDVLTYLEEARLARRQYGLIVLDPPSFSNSKMMRETLDIQRDHSRLISACLALLNQEGELLFSTNRRRFKLADTFADSTHCQEITRQTLPEDFRRHPAHRCWRLRNS